MPAEAVWSHDPLCPIRLQGDGLAELHRGQRLVSGKWVEPKEAAVRGSDVEALPVRTALQKRILCSGTLVMQPSRQAVCGRLTWDTCAFRSFSRPCLSASLWCSASLCHLLGSIPVWSCSHGCTRIRSPSSGTRLSDIPAAPPSAVFTEFPLTSATTLPETPTCRSY